MSRMRGWIIVGAFLIVATAWTALILFMQYKGWAPPF